MEEIRDKFDSIICLCAEGIEFLSRTELAELVIKEAQAGMKLCDKPEWCECGPRYVDIRICQKCGKPKK